MAFFVGANGVALVFVREAKKQEKCANNPPREAAYRLTENNVISEPLVDLLDL